MSGRLVTPRGYYAPTGPLAKGLIAAFPIEEGTGDSIYDLSGQRFPKAVLSGGASWIAGGVSCDGGDYLLSDGPLTFGDGSGVDYARSVVIAAHIDTAANCYLLGSWDAVDYYFVIDGSGRLTFIVYGAAGFVRYRLDSPTISDGDNIVAAMTYDGSQTQAGMQLYVNGVTGANGNPGSSYTYAKNSTANMAIGAFFNSGNDMAGDLQTVLIYDRELGSSEVQMLSDTIDAWRHTRNPIELWTAATSVSAGTPSGYMTLNTGYWGY